jgi:predicted small metal-binding protein
MIKEFRCGDLVPSCAAMFDGESDEEILRQVAHQHGRIGVAQQRLDAPMVSCGA